MFSSPVDGYAQTEHRKARTLFLHGKVLCATAAQGGGSGGAQQQQRPRQQRQAAVLCPGSRKSNVRLGAPNVRGRGVARALRRAPAVRRQASTLSSQWALRAALELVRSRKHTTARAARAAAARAAAREAERRLLGARGAYG